MNQASRNWQENHPKNLYQAGDESGRFPANKRFADKALEDEWNRLFGLLVAKFLEPAPSPSAPAPAVSAWERDQGV